MKAQLVKREGLRSGQKVAAEHRLAKTQQLREAAQKEQQDKVQEGVEQARQRRDGEAAPAEEADVGPEHATV